MELACALGSASATFDLLKAAIAARDDAKAKAAASDMATRLHDAVMSAIDMQQQLIAARERIAFLQNELHELKLNATDRESYAIAEVRPCAYAYARKPEQGEAVRPPYLCQPCYDQQITALLRYHPPWPGRNGRWSCPEKPTHDVADEGTAMPRPSRRVVSPGIG